jgi:hypothetical protein
MGDVLARPLPVELDDAMNIHMWAWVDEDNLHAAVWLGFYVSSPSGKP